MSMISVFGFINKLYFDEVNCLYLKFYDITIIVKF